MKTRVLSLFLAVFAYGCATSTSNGPEVLASGNRQAVRTSDTSTYLVIFDSTEDPTYGYSEENPIKTGGSLNQGVERQWKFLAGLQGPDGQELQFSRRGSCCPFESENALMGGGLLDIYEITYDGLEEPVFLYLNLYDEDELYIPVGFRAREGT